eukprot:scaffold21331_cov80-Skeletonema_menzelii.AAC.1
MRTAIPLHQWLSYLILREKRKQDAYKGEENGDSNSNDAEQVIQSDLHKAMQLEYIESAVSVALLLVKSLILDTTVTISIAAQQITIDSFSVMINGDILFRKLISALSSGERPVALFFDDLQWADNRCMELLSELMEWDHLQELDDDDDTH